MRRVALLLSGLLSVGAGYPADPDWPCVQRLVPTLTAATLWPGHEPKRSWQTNPDIAALVRDVSARGLPAEKGVALLDAFVATRPDDEARAEVFAGLVEQANAERATAIERLRSVNRHQRALAEAITRVTTELETLPAGTPTAQLEEATSRRALMIRQYEEVQKTIRYACEIPVSIEARLGRFAQALQRGSEPAIR